MLDALQLASLDFGQGNACTPEEYLFLGALVRLIAPRSIVEIGTSTGIGTLVMATALAEAGSVDREVAAAPLITIDLPLGRAMFGDGLARNRAAVERLAPAVAGLVDYRLGDSHVMLDTLVASGHRADFVFIDGGHTDAIARGDWARALGLKPSTIVLHDTVHLADVARVVSELSAEYPGVTITYPRRGLPDGAPSGSAAFGPGLTIFSNLEHVVAARSASARPVAPSGHEVLRDRIVTPAQARRLVPQAFQPVPLRELEIVLSGRNDDYGGADFHERMLTVAAFNHARLTEAGVPHRFTLVEWNPPEGKVPLIDRLRERLPWWHRSFVVSRAWHEWYQENPRLQFMEFFAKNAGIRRATGDWILTTNSDVFLGREIVARLAEGRLTPGTLYRASRLDLEREMPRDEVTWDRLEDPRHLLRRFDPEPPYMNEAAGDFLLLDRESYHRVGGFNERVRFTKIHKDGQFCIQAHHHGLAIEWMGPVYHIDHDGSFINTKHTYQPGYADAPFGPDWSCWTPYWNREDWGVRPAVEATVGASTWLRTPEEDGAVLSVILHGRGDAAARASAVASWLAEPASIEVLIVDPEPGFVETLGPHRADPRLRIIAAPDVEPGTSVAAALRIAGCCTRGRHVGFLPGALSIQGLGALADRLDGAGGGANVHGVSAGAGSSGSELTIVSRRALDRLDGIDALAGDPVGALATVARRTFGVTIVDGVEVQVIPSVDTATVDMTIDAAWSSLGGSGIVPAVVAADLTRRGELLAAHIRARLDRELPPDARDVAVFGLGPVTPFAMAAVRALRRHLIGVFAPGADGNTACAGLTVRPATELWPAPSLWVAGTCTSPSDVAALVAQVPIERTIHLVEPVSLRPEAPTFLTSTPFEGLLHARGLRTAGALREAEAAYRGVLRDPGATDAAAARYELALVHEHLGKLREAEAGFRWAFRHWPEERALVAYNLGSLYERQHRWPQARRGFSQALRLTPPHDRLRRGGCHFHLGEIALAAGDDVLAREHFARALEALPTHGKARARLAALVSA
jgi:predicted O-methyltransferase YrrM